VKVAILAEGQFAPATAKTAIGVLRYAPYPVVAVVDSATVGRDAFAVVGVGKGVPIVASVDDAIALGADALLIGTAAAGGRIPDTYRPHLARALERFMRPRHEPPIERVTPVKHSVETLLLQPTPPP
jgi:uncharacterized NAD-dependent epimerase/dehydratase family protein